MVHRTSGPCRSFCKIGERVSLILSHRIDVMIRIHTRALLAATMLLLPSVAVSQQRPTSEEAARMLRSNPALLEQLRQRILTSGLTPDQVRARLRAEGYPENLLDAYL